MSAGGDTVRQTRRQLPCLRSTRVGQAMLLLYESASWSPSARYELVKAYYCSAVSGPQCVIY